MSTHSSGDRDEDARGAGSAPPSGWSVDPDSVEGLFLAALQQEPAARETYLAEACGGDEQLKKRVRALLRAFDDADSFLETPAIARRSPEEVPLSFLEASEKEGCLGTLGPYEVTGVIGRGGMGIVLEAFDPKLSRVVAIKVLLPGLAASGSARRRFLREARAAAAISHPHVVTIHAVEEAAGGGGDAQRTVPPYLVMERVAGQSLQQKLERSGPLGVQETLRISHQIAEGLAAAHRQGVVHRDIKPANILLENGVERVKITDFGLARAIDDVTVTRTGELSGTPQYMSPEQATGGRIDHRSDLFSLGCVMYAMCTGHSPFRAGGLAHAVKRVTEETPRSIAEQNPNVPFWLIEIIESLLQKEPSNRPQHAEQLAAVCAQHLALIQRAATSGSHLQSNRSLSATPPPPPEVPRDSQPRTEPAPNRLGKIGRGLFWLGMALVIAGIAELWALVNYPMVLEAFPLLERNSQYFCLMIIGSGILLLVGGTVLSADNRGLPGWLLVLYILLGPLGLVLWMIHRDLRQPVGGSERRDLHAPQGVADDRESPADEIGESMHGKVGRYLMLGGLYVLVQPWFLILMEPVVADGGLMGIGGSFVEPAFLIGLLAIAAGYALRYIVDADQDRHRRLRPSLPILLAGLIAVVVASAIGLAQSWMAAAY